MADLNQLMRAMQAIQQPTMGQADIDALTAASRLEMSRANDFRTRRNPGGPAGGLLNISNAVFGKTHEDDALKQLTEAIGAQSGLDQYQQQMEQLRAMAEQLQKQQSLQAAGVPDARANLISQGMDLPSDMTRERKDNRTTLEKNLSAMGIDPRSPEGQALIRQNLTKSGVTVNTGDQGMPTSLSKGLLDKGLAWDAETGTLVPIPGGPADQEASEAETKAIGRQAGIQRAGGTVVQDLGRALELTDRMVGGDTPEASIARIAKSKIPGSVEWQIMDFVESAKSNIGLDRLQQMRENSPTGGALGQVPFQQQQRLEQVLGDVKIEQTPKVMKANMNRIQNIYFDIMYGSKAERAQSIKEGKMTQEQSDLIDSKYFDLPFDEFGRSKGQAPESAIQFLKQNPGSIGQFEQKYGYRPEGF